MDLLQQTALTQTVIGLGPGQEYCFRSRATDRAGNVQTWPLGDGNTCTYVGTCNVEIAPSAVSGEGVAGDVVLYTLTLTNTGSMTNAITLGPIDNNWDTGISPASVSLPSMEQTTVVVSVTIPSAATVGMSDTVTILATATGASDSSVLMTIASDSNIYLPLVRKSQ